MLLPISDTCLPFAAYILPLLLKALFINMVIIDLASVNQRNLCVSEITQQHHVRCYCWEQLHNPPQNAALVCYWEKCLEGIPTIFVAWSLLLFKLVLRELLTFAEIFLFYTVVKREPGSCVRVDGRGE